ncbi:hypothetical protein KC222_10900 [Cedecea davisae]|uniref:Uncharacterized protein YoaI n=1 Tax=Cedecea davisae TaxID=158484 RepID=A0ABS6DH39_9ENTR|nr:small membrane protein YoaI [Cedecea davisae]MBU4682523.1 hypothetical protein [Cedecea davisae]MBU4688043.1 hypothetical protein [Cedecea davisae]
MTGVIAKGGKAMNDPAFFDTLCITAVFLVIASALVMSVLYLERRW